MTLISRLLGFIRDILIAATFGAGSIADAFFIALKFPNIFRRIMAEGTLNMSFIPMFSKKLSNKNEANIFFSEIFNFLFWSLLLIVSIFEILMPALVFILAPGFLQDPEKIDLVVDLARISFPYLFYISCHTPMRGLEFNREVPARSINANICKYFNDNCFITCADNGNTKYSGSRSFINDKFLNFRCFTVSSVYLWV